VEVHRLTRTQARRIAVRAQLLDRPRPGDLHEVVRRLTLLQHDPAEAVAPSAELVVWSRLGSAYSQGGLAEALEEQSLVELQGMILPAEDLRLYRDDMARWPGRGDLSEWRHANAGWVRANEACRLDLLERLRGDGPLRSQDLPDTCVVPWRSTGWTNQRNVVQMLKLMEQRGEVAVAGREGRDKLWDLATRIYPDEPAVPAPEASRLRKEQRLRSLGISRARLPLEQVDPADPELDDPVGEPAVVEGTRGQWRVDPSFLGGPFSGRAALLSPLDRLVQDRKRMLELFEFDYQLEMFKPAAKRRWGYWALPVLYGDRLVGKLDATADRDLQALRVDTLHEDVPFTAAMTTAVHREIRDLARWLRLDLVMPDGTRRTP
jgi:uncharacterized protein YcaQ